LPKSPRPRCFVAMAVGRADTDQLYDRIVQPILRGRGVTPVLISRRQSNDDLNDQIVGQLERADLATVDLTYARPSVYFEAGFAQRAVPVIYTVRADHLAAGQPEDLRVHFDLQMKPLLLWRSPTDQGFADSLQARLGSTFLRTWTRQRKDEQAREDEQSEFASLSLLDRLAAVRRGAIVLLTRAGFHSWVVGARLDGDKREPLECVQGSNYFEATRQVRKCIQVVSLAAFRRVSRLALKEAASPFISTHLGAYQDAKSTAARSLDVHHLLLALDGIPKTLIEGAFQSASPGEIAGHCRRPLLRSTDAAGKTGQPLTNVHYHFLSPIRCLSDLEDRLRPMLSLIHLKRGRRSTSNRPRG
jgi:hypothetical protein